MKKEVKIDLIAFAISVFLCFVILIIRIKNENIFPEEENSLLDILKALLYPHPKILLNGTGYILFLHVVFPVAIFYFSFLFFKRYLPVSVAALFHKPTACIP